MIDLPSPLSLFSKYLLCKCAMKLSSKTAFNSAFDYKQMMNIRVELTSG